MESLVSIDYTKTLDTSYAHIVVVKDIRCGVPSVHSAAIKFLFVIIQSLVMNYVAYISLLTVGSFGCPSYPEKSLCTCPNV